MAIHSTYLSYQYWYSYILAVRRSTCLFAASGKIYTDRPNDAFDIEQRIAIDVRMYIVYDTYFILKKKVTRELRGVSFLGLHSSEQ